MKMFGVVLSLAWLLLCRCKQGNSNNLSTLTILSLLPYPDPQGRDDFQPAWGDGPAVYLAADLAVDLINKRSDILSGHKLELIQGDSGCNEVSKASTALVENLFYKSKTVLGIIGPGCSTAGLAVSKIISTNHRSISIPTIHLGGSHLFLTEREMFPLSFSMLDVTNTSVNAILALMQHNGWSRFSILYDESHLYYASIVERIRRSRVEGLTIPNAAVVQKDHIPFGEVRDSENRIIMLLVGENMFSRVLCIALRSGLMYPTYQWVFLNRMLSDFRPVNTTYGGKRTSCNLGEILTAAEQSIFLTYHDSSNSLKREPTTIGLTRKQFKRQYTERIRRYNRRNNANMEPNFWATFYFDAAWAFGLALNNSEEELRSLGLRLAEFEYGKHQVTDIIKKQILQLSFEGVSGRIEFDRTSGFISRGKDILQLRHGELQVMLYFNGSDLVALRHNAKLVVIEDNFDNFGTLMKVPVPVITLCVIATVAILIILASFHYISIAYRSFPSLKASNLRIIQMAYVGSYLIVAGIVCESVGATLNSREKQCELVQSSLVLGFCGMTLIFSTICVRTWRLYRIFIHFNNPGRFISDRALFFFVCFCLSLELPVVLIWAFADPIYPVSVRNISMNTIQIRCTSETLKLWFSCLLSYNSLLLLLSCYFGLRSYKVSPKAFKSSSVLILAYLLSIEIPLGVGVYFLLPERNDPLQKYLAINVTLLVYIALCLGLLFLPPILPLLKSDRRKHYNSLKCY